MFKGRAEVPHFAGSMQHACKHLRTCACTHTVLLCHSHTFPSASRPVLILAIMHLLLPQSTRAAGKKGGEWVYASHDPAVESEVLAAVHAAAPSGKMLN